MKFKKNDEYKTIKKVAGKIEIKPVLKPSMPKTVKIDTVRYSVMEKELLIDGNETIAGQINYRNSVIEISGDRSEDQKRITLMHEIVHGVLADRGLIKHIESGTRETVVEEISKSFVQIIQDNPDLIDYIRDEVTPRSIK